MEPFDIINGEVVISPTALAIPQFKALWDRDKSKHKENAIKEITYVVFLCGFKSPYRDMTEEDRIKHLKKDVIGNEKWEPDQKVQDAINIFKKMQETPLSRFLDANLKSIDKITNFLESLSFEGIGNEKAFKVMDSLMKANEKAGGMIKSIIALKKQVQMENEEMSARGNSEIGFYELPKKQKNAKKDNY